MRLKSFVFYTLLAAAPAWALSDDEKRLQYLTERSQTPQEETKPKEKNPHLKVFLSAGFGVVAGGIGVSLIKKGTKNSGKIVEDQHDIDFVPKEELRREFPNHLPKLRFFRSTDRSPVVRVTFAYLGKKKPDSTTHSSHLTIRHEESSSGRRSDVSASMNLWWDDEGEGDKGEKIKSKLQKLYSELFRLKSVFLDGKLPGFRAVVELPHLSDQDVNPHHQTVLMLTLAAAAQLAGFEVSVLGPQPPDINNALRKCEDSFNPESWDNLVGLIQGAAVKSNPLSNLARAFGVSNPDGSFLNLMGPLLTAGFSAPPQEP